MNQAPWIMAVWTLPGFSKRFHISAMKKNSAFVFNKWTIEGGPARTRNRFKMAFTFAAFCYLLAMLLAAVLIFFAIFHVSIHRYVKSLFFYAPILFSFPDRSRKYCNTVTVNWYARTHCKQHTYTYSQQSWQCTRKMHWFMDWFKMKWQHAMNHWMSQMNVVSKEDWIQFSSEVDSSDNDTTNPMTKIIVRI